MDEIAIKRGIDKVREENKTLHSNNWKLQVENMRLIDENRQLRNGTFIR